MLILLGCPIPLAKDPDRIVIPNGRTPDKIVKNLSYVIENELLNNGSQSTPLFGGHQSWSEREKSFKLRSTMKVKFLFSCQYDCDCLLQVYPSSYLQFRKRKWQIILTFLMHFN